MEYKIYISHYIYRKHKSEILPNTPKCKTHPATGHDQSDHGGIFSVIYLLKKLSFAANVIWLIGCYENLSISCKRSTTYTPSSFPLKVLYCRGPYSVLQTGSSLQAGVSQLSGSYPESLHHSIKRSHSFMTLISFWLPVNKKKKHGVAGPDL